MAYIDRNKVHKYRPKNRGVISAVQWNGLVECLVGLPNLNQVMIAVKEIDRSGFMSLVCTGDDEPTNVRPNKDYVVIDQFGKLTVYSEEAMKANYDIWTEEQIAQELDKALWPHHKEGERDNRVGRTITVISADRPDDT